MFTTKIYNIINTLAITNKEKTTLQTYFCKNFYEIDKAIGVLNTCQCVKQNLTL